MAITASLDLAGASPLAMWRDLLRFEWRYQTRRLGFAAVAGCFALVGFALAATGFGPQDVHLDSPYSIAQSIGLASLVAVLAATFACAQGGLRDPEHRMAEIVYATAVSRAQYVLGRWLGVVAATFAAFAWVVPGMLAGTFLVAHEAGEVAPFRLLPYLWALLLLALPNLLLITALLYGVALLGRSALATYVSGVLVYALYFVAALFSGSPLMAGTSPPTVRGMAIAALVDPFGLSAFFAQTRYWTVAERDERLLTLGGHLLANRLLCLLATALLLLLVCRAFSFRLPAAAPAGRRGRRGVAARPQGSDAAALGATGDAGRWAVAGIATESPAARAGWSPWVSRAAPAIATLVATARLEIRQSLRSWPFVALVVGWMAVATMELGQSFQLAEYGSALLPVTSLVLAQLRPTLQLFALLAIVYFAAEAVWRERTTGMAEIVDATPVSNGALLLGKLSGLVTMLVLLIAAAAVSGMAFQLALGWTGLQPLLWASLLLTSGVPLLLVAVLTVLVQVLVPNRYLGIVVSAGLVAWWHLGALGGPDHPLLRYAAAPAVPYSELGGFGPEMLSLGWFAAYWSAFALLLAMAGAALWRRGSETSLRARLAAARCGSWRTSRVGLAAAAAFLWVVLGVAVYMQTNRWNEYRTGRQTEAWNAGYERTYGWLAERPQPVPVDVRLAVDLHPEERRYRVRGTYQLENRSGQAIDAVWVTTRRDLQRPAELALGGRQPDVVREAAAEVYGTYRFTLPAPLPPGGRTELAFDVAVARRGATAGQADYGIVRQGSFLLGNFSLPSIGYRRSYQLDDPEARRRQGLPPRAASAALEGGDAAQLAQSAGVPIAFEATLSTAPGQIAIAPGSLVAQGERDGRPWFRYRSTSPISPVVAFTSASWTVTRRMHGGIPIEVYHHPAHGRNVEAMLTAAASALDYCSAQFGPYPHRELRIVELPSFWRQRFSGFAVPGTIFVVESRGFLTDRGGGGIDVVSKRVAHEVAHQWWGHQVSPPTGPGATPLVETLARYTELRVLAALHGEAAARPALGYELDSYLAARADDSDEPSLATVQRENYVYYAKGALVMAAVRDLLGEAATSAALRRLVDDARAGRQPDGARMLAYLQAAAHDGRDRRLLAEWWRGIVLYDLGVSSARATPLPGGRQLLTVELAARRTDEVGGKPRPLPFDEEVELAVYTAQPGPGEETKPLAVRRFRLRGDTSLVLAVDAAARWVVIDPHLLRIDRDRADNARAIGG